MLIHCHAVTLTFDPLDLEHRLSSGQSVYQSWLKSINLRPSYWWFTTVFSSALEGAPIHA